MTIAGAEEIAKLQEAVGDEERKWIPAELRADIGVWALIAVVFFAGAAAGVLSPLTPTKTVTKHAPAEAVQIGGYADVVKALGPADQEVPGEQINAQLAGATCGVWSSKQLVVCG